MTRSNTRRPLTQNERQALPQGLVRAVDIEAVSLIHANHLVSLLSRIFGQGALIVVRGSKIFWPQLTPDLSLAPRQLALLAHELTHVWQYQNGMTIWHYLWRERGQYHYQLDVDKAFTAYGFEQQAAIVEDWVRHLNGLETRYSRDKVSLKHLEDVIPFAHQ